MSRLSPSSVAILKGKKGPVQDPKKASTSQLLNELSQMAQSIINSTKASFSSWSLSCDTPENNNDGFAYTFTTAHETAKEVQLKLQVNTRGDSYLEAGIESDNLISEDVIGDVSNFMKTPAAKRYFQISTSSASKIKAIIPKREVVSRYFEDYVQHLIQQLEPLINSMVAYQLKLN